MTKANNILLKTRVSEPTVLETAPSARQGALAFCRKYSFPTIFLINNTTPTNAIRR
jgi:hypothetical protein